MAEHATNPDAMAHGAATLEHAGAQVQTHLRNLRADLEALVSNSHGDADGPVHRHDAFEQQAQKITNALRQMHQVLQPTHAQDFSGPDQA